MIILYEKKLYMKARQGPTVRGDYAPNTSKL
jgi:hypothetical protein